jgi:uncharacterized membrane protein YesL
MKQYFKHANRIGIFLALLFIICFAWYWIRPMHQSLQMQIMEYSFFGFKSMNFFSFILGLIQSYIWGYIGVALWHISSGCCKGYCKK